ncbi:MAG: sensor histidine kinase [Propionibacteriaceae bacterium]|nr:sensor histidine kinase [Propionibacteriaceae bacterium]
MITWPELRRLDAARPWLLDTCLAAGLLLASVLAAGAAQAGPPPAWVIGLLIAAAAPYSFRRAAPLPTLVVAGLLVCSLILLGQGTAVIGSALFLAAYTVAAQEELPATVSAAVFCLVLLVVVALTAPQRMGWPETATNLALFVGSFALGRASRSRQEAARLEAERAELAELAQAEVARSAASEERLRIARELHDVVGHSLGVIALQAGVGARVARSDPEEARSSLLAIADRSRASLHEVRQILGALRSTDDDLEPTPGLDDLDRLVTQAAATNLGVTIEQVGEPWSVSEALGLTVYRLVQESLTNVVRHARARTAHVRIRYTADRLILTVTDDGTGLRPGTAVGTGQIGMRERVAIWDGELHAGNRAEGGYEVSVSIPRPEEARS